MAQLPHSLDWMRDRLAAAPVTISDASARPGNPRTTPQPQLPKDITMAESKGDDRTFVFTSESVNEGHPGALVL